MEGVARRAQLVAQRRSLTAWMVFPLGGYGPKAGGQYPSFSDGSVATKTPG